MSSFNKTYPFFNKKWAFLSLCRATLRARAHAYVRAPCPAQPHSNFSTTACGCESDSLRFSVLFVTEFSLFKPQSLEI